MKQSLIDDWVEDAKSIAVILEVWLGDGAISIKMGWMLGARNTNVHESMHMCMHYFVL